jgi:hypothetical protein
VDFQNGSRLSEADLDTAYQQGLFVAQEVSEDANTNQYVNLVDAALLANTSLSEFSSSSHTGDASEVTFDLSFVPKTSIPQAFLVIIDGVLQSPVDAYTVSIAPAQITFASAPPLDAEIVVTTTAAATGTLWEDVYLFKDIPDVERATYTSPNLGTKALSETSIQASRGSASTPSSVSEPIIALKKTSDYTGGEQNPTAVFLIEKRTQADGARAQGVFIEAVDYAGFDGVGDNNFIEGLRSHAIVGQGATNGSAYGAILFAGAESNVDWKYLVGAEGDVANNKNDAPSVDSFDKNNFCASFLATSGFGTKKVDAGFATNPFNTANTLFKTGFLVPEDSVEGSAFASRAASVIGLDLSNGSQSYAAITMPNGASVRIKNADNSADLNCLYLSTDNELHLGSETEGCRMTLSGGYTDRLIEVGAANSAGAGYRTLRIAN